MGKNKKKKNPNPNGGKKGQIPRVKHKSLIKKKKFLQTKKHKWGTKKRQAKEELGDHESAGNANIKMSKSHAYPGPLSFHAPVDFETALREQYPPARLADQMRGKLAAARFRRINEALHSSQNPKQAFHEDFNIFQEYHATYNSLRARWDMDPREVVGQIIVEMVNHKKLKKIEVADFGCGDGGLGKMIERDLTIEKTIYYLDLWKVHPETIECDMAEVPLADDTVDVGVFCLSLMAEEIQKYIIEANRLIRKGGTLIIAEIEKKFSFGVGEFVSKLRLYGFAHKKKKLGDILKFNDMFVILEFTKAHDISKTLGRQMPKIYLNCSEYKKR